MNRLSILPLILLFLMNQNVSFCMSPKRTPVDANKKQLTGKGSAKELNEREIVAIIASLDDIKASKKNK